MNFLNWGRAEVDYFYKLIDRKKKYKEIFSKDDAEYVLADLARFCFARESCFDTDPLKMAHKEGRREVFLRIMDFINKSDKEIYEFMDKQINSGDTTYD